MPAAFHANDILAVCLGCWFGSGRKLGGEGTSGFGCEKTVSAAAFEIARL